MSRTGLHKPRLSRAVSHRPAPDTRLLPSPSLPNTHIKRCPKAQRLNLRSDLSPSRPMQGRFPDKSRHAPYKGHSRVSAPLTWRNGIAPSGDALEHGVKMLTWAIAPSSDSPGVDLAGRSEQSEVARLKTNRPYKDSTVVTIGELRSTNGGHGSPLPSPGVVEHFRWTGLPQSENISCLVHILSEVWGCRRVDAGVDRPMERTPRIGTGVADYLRKPSGIFHRHPSLSVIPDSGRASTPRGWGSACPERSRRACPESLEGERGTKGVRVSLLKPDMQPSTASFQPPVRNLSFPSHQYQTRSIRPHPGAGVCLCFFLPLSLKGPKSLPRTPIRGRGG